ncbi:helix-turn-helix domain-containing protein [Rhizobium daejeonense]
MMCILHSIGVRFDLTVMCALCTLGNMTNDPDLRQIRFEKGWTQLDVANMLGVDRSTVSRCENGAPMSSTMRRLLMLILREGKDRPEAAE